MTKVLMKTRTIGALIGNARQVAEGNGLIFRHLSYKRGRPLEFIVEFNMTTDAGNKHLTGWFKNRPEFISIIE